MKRVNLSLEYRKLSSFPVRFLTFVTGRALGEDSVDVASVLVCSVTEERTLGVVAGCDLRLPALGLNRVLRWIEQPDRRYSLHPLPRWSC